MHKNLPFKKSVNLLCFNKPASWIGYEVNQSLKDPVCTWDLILVKESQPLTPAVTAGWGTDDQFISPSLSLNERTSAILPFQSLIKTFKYWSARETLPLRESMPSVFPRALCPRAGYGLRHYWLSESYKVSVGSLSADEESGLTCICQMHRFWTLKGGEFVLETPVKEDTQR